MEPWMVKAGNGKPSEDCGRVTNKKEKIKICVVWFERCVSLATFICCFYYSCAFINEYLKYPSVQILEIDTSESVQFPTVTICNLNRIRKSRLCDKNENDYGKLPNKSLKIMSDMIELEFTKCAVPRYEVQPIITYMNGTIHRPNITALPEVVNLTGVPMTIITNQPSQLPANKTNLDQVERNASYLITGEGHGGMDQIPKPKKIASRMLGGQIGSSIKPDLQVVLGNPNAATKNNTGGFTEGHVDQVSKFKIQSRTLGSNSKQPKLQLGLPDTGVKTKSREFTLSGQKDGENHQGRSLKPDFAIKIMPKSRIIPAREILVHGHGKLDLGKLPDKLLKPKPVSIHIPNGIVPTGPNNTDSKLNQSFKKDAVKSNTLTVYHANKTEMKNINRRRKRLVESVENSKKKITPIPKGYYKGKITLALFNVEKKQPPHIKEQIQFEEFYEQLDSEAKYFLGYNYNDIVKECSFNGIECRQLFGEATRFLNSEFGTCYELRLKNPVTRGLGINSGLQITYDINGEDYTLLSLQTTTTQALRMVLSHPEVVAAPENEGFLVTESQDNYLSLKQVEYRRLKAPYSDECRNYSDQTHPYNNRKGCWVHCAQVLNIKRCGCSDPNWPKLGNEKRCTFLNLTEASCIVKVLNDINDHKEKCVCPLPCKEDIYTMTQSSALMRNNGFRMIDTSNPRSIFEGKFRVYFESLDKMVHSSVPKYTALDILSNLGGQLGLWLGLSLMTLANSCVSSMLLKLVNRNEGPIFKTKPKKVKGKSKKKLPRKLDIDFDY